MDYANAIAVIDATIRTSTPLVLAALGGLISERAGIVDIGLEGKMLAAAFAGAAVAAEMGSAVIGLLGGVAASVLLALLHGFACITHRGSQVVTGLAINILASGLTVTLGTAWFGRGGATPELTGAARFEEIALPFHQHIGAVPIVGPLYEHVLSGHSVLVYAAFVAVPVVWWIVYETRFGLRARAAGEHPAAVDTAGVSVNRLRYEAVVLTGVFCGLSGVYLSVALNGGFDRDMTAGRGYLALAAIIFAKWRPTPVFATCLLFGLLEAVQVRLQDVPVFGVGLPVELIQALPFILTVVLLAGLIGRAEPPRASGTPYVKEH